MHHIMAKLVSLDSEYKLKVVGKFCDELYEEYFYDQVKKLGLKDNVSFLGNLTHDVMVDHLQQADFFLITSIIEGLSQASLEAMSCGVRPVIDDYFESDKAYPIQYIYRTVDEAVEKILHPVGSRRESRDFIEAHYGLDDKVDAIQKLIEELI
jgi:glycosyltransferase involved in cell wall biosynthesis